MGEYFVYLAKDSVSHNNSDSAKPNNAGDSAKPGNTGDSANAPKLRAVQVKIETGQTIGSNIVVKSGIKDGDRLVVDGVQALHDGSAITTANRVGPTQPGRR